MRPVPGSLRARLLLVSTLGASAALVLSLILLYLMLVRQLNTALDDDLAQRGHDLATATTQGDLGAVQRDPLAQLYAGDGTLIGGSPSLARVRLLSVPEVRSLTGSELTHRSLPQARGDEPARQLSRRIPHGRVLAVAVSTRTVQAARERLAVVLFLAAPALIGVLAVVGWLVIRAALRPVRLLTREAAAITSLDIGHRLPRVPGDDEIAELARTLDGMLTRLRVAVERERAFVDDASHELRTPVAVLRGQLELALATIDHPEEVERSLHASLAEVERLTGLTDDLLLLARERAGTLILRAEPIDLLDLAGAEARRLGPALGLRVEVAGEPAVIDGDGERLRQVIGNLAANSAAAAASVLRLTITRGPGSVTLEAADDGPGFPPGLLDSAFERFARGDPARTRGASGAGLGLSIVLAVTVAHGGSVEAGNGAPLGGAVVTVRLPVG
ncbi:ATP-binding protein [Actinoallomurus bryophytorum]|uniref:histidine kinase n=1 Tax=Actinoallomurus bryophytorum TaxID=1490222 RepID=A0A543BTM5_9ACTN|nr:ATP-binding protein [Actinoallomurus bryophytorum]TQL88178.1 signal transduction histidine kinase [Actinoallomurus bryophytorum]